MNARLELTTPSNPMDFARMPEDLRTQVFAGVIHEALRIGRRPLIRGIGEAEFQRLLAIYFPGLLLINGTESLAAPPAIDEYEDLVELLLAYRVWDDVASVWLVHAVATAAMGERHLWQDMGLPSRCQLSDTMTTHFPELAAKNVGDMKWKKFFYRQLCEQAGVPICKSPHCAECCDYPICFGLEV